MWDCRRIGAGNAFLLDYNHSRTDLATLIGAASSCINGRKPGVSSHENGGRVDRVAHGSSPAFAVVRKHLHRHGMFEAPDHADRPFALVTDQVRRAEAGERQGHRVAFFLAAGKHQHRIQWHNISGTNLPMSCSLRSRHEG